MFCHKCGAQLLEGAKFCSSCGTPVNTDTEERPEQPERPDEGRKDEPKKDNPPYQQSSPRNNGCLTLLLVAVITVLLLAMMSLRGCYRFVFSRNDWMEDFFYPSYRHTVSLQVKR